MELTDKNETNETDSLCQHKRQWKKGKISLIYIRNDYCCYYFEVCLGMVEQSKIIKLKALKEMDYCRDA